MTFAGQSRLGEATAVKQGRRNKVPSQDLYYTKVAKIYQFDLYSTVKARFSTYVGIPSTFESLIPNKRHALHCTYTLFNYIMIVSVRDLDVR